MILRRKVIVLIVLCFLLSSIPIGATNHSISNLNEASTSWEFHLTNDTHTNDSLKQLQDPTQLIDHELQQSQTEDQLNEFVTHMIDHATEDSIVVVYESYIEQLLGTKDQLLQEDISDHFQGMSDTIETEVTKDITEFLDDLLSEQVNNN